MSLDAILHETLMLVAVVSGIPIFISTVVSLLVAIFQAATQVQEQSVGFCVKIITISGVFVLCGGYFCSWIIEFFQKTLIGIGTIGG